MAPGSGEGVWVWSRIPVGEALCEEQCGAGGGEGRSHPGFLRLPSRGDCSVPRLRAVLPQRGETWPMPNCSQATCEGNGVISVQPRPCPQAQPPTCANGFPPVKVADHDSCCPHYQCQCEPGARRGGGAGWGSHRGSGMDLG